MALNKKQASTATRIGIAAVAVILVISFIPGVWGFFGGNGTGNANTGTDSTIDLVSQDYAGQIQFNDQTLASDPTSYTVLVNQGNLYFDWALAVAENSPATSLPMWNQSAVYFERALGVRADDALVMTDLSIVYERVGRIDEAVAVAQAATQIQPPFSPAYYHLGRYLQTRGDNAGARAALEMYLQLDPNGQTPGGDPADAQSRLGALPQTAPSQETTALTP